MIYPTLDLLQDQGLISVEDDNGRKKILISEEGKQLHAENQEHLAHIQERLQARMVGCELRRDPQMEARAGKLQSGPRPESEPAGQQCRPAQADHRHY